MNDENNMADKVKQAIPGQVDDKIIDTAQNVMNSAGGAVGQGVDATKNAAGAVGQGVQNVAGGAANTAQNAAGAAGGAAQDAAQAAANVANTAVDKATQVIPGQVDDKIVEGVRGATSNAGGFLSKIKNMFKK